MFNNKTKIIFNWIRKRGYVCKITKINKKLTN